MPGPFNDINDPRFFFGRKPLSEEEQFMRDLQEHTISEEVVAWEQAENAREAAASKGVDIRIHSLSWRHTEESRKGAQKARDGDTIRVLCGIDGCPDGTNVLFELSWVEKGGSPAVFTKATAPLKDGVAATDVLLDFSKIAADEYTIHFTPSARGKHGSNCKIPLAAPIVDRWIIFEEATEFGGVVDHYERWEPGPAKERWIYLFATVDGEQYKDVWEIRTDAGGKFNTRKLTKDNYDDPPESEFYEDVALLPANNDSGKKYTFFAALSDIRLPVERIFESKTGLTNDPEKRCVNIDDSRQVARRVDVIKDANGGTVGSEEHVILVNYLQRAEQLRADFDIVREEWEALRLPSSAESSEERKKQKQLMEFGALINIVLEAFPKYKKQLSEEGYRQLQKDLQQYETEKATKTGEIGGKVLVLCDWIDTEQFAETCRDYLALITEGEDQPQEWYDFEERIGNLLEGLTRFPRGQETLGKLLKKTGRVEENSWLQDLLLLKNDTWNSDGEQLFDEDAMEIPQTKTYTRIRKISQRFVDILAEAARRGVNEFKPEEMAGILQKVLRTSGAYFGMELVETTVRNRPAVKPFAGVLGDFSETSFWRFGFDKSISYDNAAARFITSKGLDNLLKALEGVSVVFALKELSEKPSATLMDKLDIANGYAGVASYFAENLLKVKYRGQWVKLGTGPIQVVNAISGVIDAIVSFKEATKEQSTNDTDCAIWNLVASGGFFVSAVGSGALAATFFAGAAGLSATGIGIAPGLVLAVIGTVIAIGSKTMADISNNSEMEDLLLQTPWGTHSEVSLEQVSFFNVKDQYVKAVQILNTFTIILDVGKQTAEIQLRRLEPETKITLKEVVFATSTSGKYEEKAIGKDLQLNAANATVTKLQQATCVNVDLSIICGVGSDTYWMANRPDFVRVQVQIDLFGDKKVLLPDQGKYVTVQCYAGQKTETNTL